VHATRDGVVVIHHDETLERMAGDGRAIADLDWSELRRVTTKGGARVPRLDELLSSFPDLLREYRAQVGQRARAARRSSPPA
jgi:glycerophosphoryl diester phosphodiesterase